MQNDHAGDGAKVIQESCLRDALDAVVAMARINSKLSTPTDASRGELARAQSELREAKIKFHELEERHRRAMATVQSLERKIVELNSQAKSKPTRGMTGIDPEILVKEIEAQKRLREESRKAQEAASAAIEAVRKIPGMYRVNALGKVEFSSPQALTAAEWISRYDAELGRLPWLEEIVKGAQRFKGTLTGEPSKKKRRR